MKSKLLLSKKASMSGQGIDLGLGAIFILAIGLTVTVSIIDNMTTGGVNASNQITGVAATVADFAPLVVVAGFIFFVAKLMGMI